ncbi:MAG: substrate-binding domain-containing protein [Cyanobacteria bacterium P01_H01_bin.15]
MGNRQLVSVGIAAVSLGLAVAPLPGVQQTLYVVSGSELQEPLAELETIFEKSYPHIDIELKFQGSQDIVNNYLDNRNDFTPAIVIPANGALLTLLAERWQVQEQSEPFYGEPQPIAKTLLVGIAWPERGKALFGQGAFEWSALTEAMRQRSWSAIGGENGWGSFDMVTTDPTRSNSGQLAIALLLKDALQTSQLDRAMLTDSTVISLVDLLKKSVYQPPRSTDILLQEFIARGPNDADVGLVYESIALHRWDQAGVGRQNAYQIYYLNPTIETVSTAAILRRDVSNGEAKAAQTFIDFLREPEQQAVFVQYGFRPAAEPGIDLTTVPESPWAEGIPGAETDPSLKIVSPPDPSVLGEIQRLWNRAN